MAGGGSTRAELERRTLDAAYSGHSGHIRGQLNKSLPSRKVLH
jgi:hypothetical protein